MKFGWCAPPQEADRLARIGYDYIEVPLAGCGLEDETTRRAAQDALQRLPLRAETFNYFFPNDMIVVGPVVDTVRIKTYLARAGELMGAVGARIAVCGSGWARNAPPGWPLEAAADQFVEALGWAADAARGSGVTVVIEPLNRTESTLANSVAEAVAIARRVGRPEIRVLADFYHMDEEAEPLDEVFHHRRDLAHVHLADTRRLNPGTGQYDYPRFFGLLKAAGYAGSLSVECWAERTDEALATSLAFLRRQWADASPLAPLPAQGATS
jgi:sugar phosphate isomerase/epimerase